MSTDSTNLPSFRPSLRPDKSVDMLMSVNPSTQGEGETDLGRFLVQLPGAPELDVVDLGAQAESGTTNLITIGRDHFRRSIIAPKESFEFLFVRVQTPQYVADNVGASIERSSLLPLLRLSR